MQRWLWTQMCTLFNKNMKYDLASGELKDTYKNINKRCSLRLGRGHKTSSDSAYCIVKFRFLRAPWKCHDESCIILFLWPCGDNRIDAEVFFKPYQAAFKHLKLNWIDFLYDRSSMSTFQVMNLWWTASYVWKELTIWLWVNTQEPMRILIEQGFTVNIHTNTQATEWK